MRRRHAFGSVVSMCLFAAVSVSLLASGAAAQFLFTQPSDLAPIGSGVQMAVIDSITAALKEAYVFADKAAQMDSLLRANLAAGTYRGLTDPAQFMAKLQSDVATIYLDRHMEMWALPPGAGPTGLKDDPRGSDAYNEVLRRSNYGFKKVEMLGGNVGYLKFNQFIDTDLAGATAAAAMSFVAHADALIIDLRENGGGNASMIQLLTGYFFRNRVHLIDWYDRRKNETTQSWSNDWVPGQTMYDTPVYVLVSSLTGSAAEEFAYDLKNEKRATIVGETTGGAAHTVEYHNYDVGPFVAGIKLPSGRAISPVTKTNWEATGVEPDIMVAADKALAAAHLDALNKLQDKTSDEAAQKALAWASIGLQCELEPYTVPAKALKEYVGTFGPRKIFMEGSKLMYQREERPKVALVPMSKDLFALEGVGYFRVRFTRNATGTIDTLIGLYDDGREEPNAKTK